MTDINEATKHATEQEAMIKQTQNDGEQLSTMLALLVPKGLFSTRSPLPACTHLLEVP